MASPGVAKSKTINTYVYVGWSEFWCCIPTKHICIYISMYLYIDIYIIVPALAENSMEIHI